MSDEIQQFLNDPTSVRQRHESFAEGGASAGSSGGARQAGPPPSTPEPSVPAETAEDDAGRDAAGADDVKESSSAAAPRAVITISQGTTRDEIHFDVDFDPPYDSDRPAPTHTVAIAMIDLASRYMGELTDISLE